MPDFYCWPVLDLYRTPPRRQPVVRRVRVVIVVMSNPQGRLGIGAGIRVVRFQAVLALGVRLIAAVAIGRVLPGKRIVVRADA